MSETKVPALKKVPTADGSKLGSSYQTLTTPNPTENKIGWKTKEETGSIFSKK